jgi:hypothetical protein
VRRRSSSRTADRSRSRRAAPASAR